MKAIKIHEPGGREVMQYEEITLDALADAAKAHQDLEGRRTTGSTVLLP